MGGFENSSISNLNPHLNITSLDFQVDVSWICVLCFNVMSGPPTHVYVTWLIVTGKGIASEFLNFQIYVSEIIICLNTFLMLLVIRFRELRASLSFAMGLTITGRPLFQCLICVERYLAVVDPVTFLKFKPLRYREICSTAVCIAGLVSCVLYTVVSYEAFIWISFLQFLFSLSTQLFCLVAVLRALKQSGPGERNLTPFTHFKLKSFRDKQRRLVVKNLN